jgi:hypothetical protein
LKQESRIQHKNDYAQIALREERKGEEKQAEKVTYNEEQKKQSK